MGWAVDTHHCGCQALFQEPKGPLFLIQKCQDHPSPFVGMRGEIMSLACKIWAFISLVSVYLLYGWFSLAIKCEGIRTGAGSTAPQIHFL